MTDLSKLSDAELTALYEQSAARAVPAGVQAMTDDQLREAYAKAQKSYDLSDIPAAALRNLPGSAAKFATDIVQPILHPVDTAQALWALGKGGASKIGNATGIVNYSPEERQKLEAPLDAVGGFFKDRYGSWEAARRTMAEDPVGFMSDAATVLTGGSMAAAKAPGMVGKVARTAGRVGDAIDPLMVAGRGIAAGAGAAGKAASNVLDLTTGAGGRAIEEAAKAGYQGNRVFLEQMRPGADMDAPIAMTRNALNAMRQDRNAAYTAGMGTVRQNSSILDFAPVDQALSSSRSMFQYGNTIKSSGAKKVWDDIADKVAEWKAQPPQMGPGPNGKPIVIDWPHRTPEGFDALKQAIGEIRSNTPPGSLERKVADDAYNSVKAQIVKAAPEYAEAMEGYAKASQELSDLTRTFSAGEKASSDTTLRKLQSVMRNNVNTNYGKRVQMAEELARYEPDLMPALAGQALNSWTPRGLSRITGTMGLAGGVPLGAYLGPQALGALAAAPFFSPRAMGEAAYAAGRGANYVNRGVDAFGLTGPRVGAAGRAAFQAGRAENVIEADEEARPLRITPKKKGLLD